MYLMRLVPKSDKALAKEPKNPKKVHVERRVVTPDQLIESSGTMLCRSVKPNYKILSINFLVSRQGKQENSDGKSQQEQRG